MAQAPEYYLEPEAEWLADGAGPNRDLTVAVRSVAISFKRFLDWLTGEETTKESASARYVAWNTAAKANDQAAACPGDTGIAGRGATE